MRSDNTQLLWKSEEHPPLEVLREYQEDTLPAPASHEVEKHLLDCELCTDLVQGMTLSDRSTTRKAVGNLNAQLRNMASRKRKKRLPLIPLLEWRAAATILVLLCSIGLVVYFLNDQIQRERLAKVRNAELAAQAELYAISSTTDTLFIDFPGYSESAAPATKPAPPAVAYQKPATANRGGIPAPEKAEATTGQTGQPSPQAAAAMVAGAAIQDKTDLPLPDTTRHHSDFLAKATAPPVVRSSTESIVLDAGNRRKQLDGQVLSESEAGNIRKLLKGQVLSEEGKALPGVTVVLKGAAQGTSTDLQGNFTIPAPSEKAMLSFSYTGYKPEDVPVDQKTASVKVELTPDFRSLHEVVVEGISSEGATSGATASIKPVPATGMKDFEKYIEQNRRYPVAVRPEKVSGRVVVSFTVTAQGHLENIRIQKSLHPALDAEAIRLVKEGPSWKPALTKGKPVAERVKVSIRFKPE